jgi:Domain of unknown function (DUF5664)
MPFTHKEYLLPTLTCGCDLEAKWICTVHQLETRIVDPKTGGEKGSKLARFDLIPPAAMWALAEVYGAGCKKYSDRNWEKGYAWGLSIAALERHLNLWKQGESIDKETGCHHLMQVVWHAVALFIFELKKLGTDDVRIK